MSRAINKFINISLTDTFNRYKTYYQQTMRQQKSLDTRERQIYIQQDKKILVRVNNLI